MFTKLLVIQKINKDATIDLFQSSYGHLQWSFDSNRIQTPTDKEYFPFSVELPMKKGQPGSETTCILKDEEIIFSDSYAIPEGVVIAVLFPKNYIPDIIKLNDRPAIPVRLTGMVTSTSPGQFEIMYNGTEKRCAIVFHIFNGTAFGMKCIAKRVSDEAFPKGGNVIRDEVFDIVLSREFLDVEAITTEDLKLINETLAQIDLVDIQQTLNDLLTAVKAGKIAESKTLFHKAGNLLLSGTSVVSNLTTIADSYKAGDSAQQFIARILEYFSL
jgi:hypothetical protein